MRPMADGAAIGEQVAKLLNKPTRALDTICGRGSVSDYRRIPRVAAPPLSRLQKLFQ